MLQDKPGTVGEICLNFMGYIGYEGSSVKILY